MLAVRAEGNPVSDLGVAAEDGRKPLSDHRISDILAQQGIQVARRTVAKYREAMHIQPANLRKSI